MQTLTSYILLLTILNYVLLFLGAVLIATTASFTAMKIFGRIHRRIVKRY